MRLCSTRRRLMAIVMVGALAGCATPYTGPIEVNRFVAESAVELATGSVAINTASDAAIEPLQSVYAQAVSRELRRIGFSTGETAVPDHVAFVRIERSQLETRGGRSPVNVGVGGSTGSYGSGVGLGVGINLGGSRAPRFVTELAVRITQGSTGNTLWEGRAEIVTSSDSYAGDPEANSRLLATALFRDFPGGNAETVTINVNELQGNP